jgi:hypothetical protein
MATDRATQGVSVRKMQLEIRYLMSSIYSRLAAAILLVATVARPIQSEPIAKHLQIVPAIAPISQTSVPDKNRLNAYLMVYFKDETHSLYFATSEDGYAFTDVNAGQPVLLGKDVAEQKGIRDPHIMRGPDNAFYLAMTDLHIFAQKEGLRPTRWERPEAQYDWGNNRGMIFMKSYDLVHWTYAHIRIDRLFPAFGDIGCAWAPETIYDQDRKQLMVYFTTRIGKGVNYLVYSYADDAFTT